jgi:7-cyano-7-deazaguanine synthase
MAASKPIAIVLVSGGLDSVTLAYDQVQAGYDVQALSVFYGQRHARELEAARYCMGLLGVSRHDILDMRGMGALLEGSALTDPTLTVPHGHYEAETMRATVVPNRNMILLSVAWGVAVARNAERVAIAAHSGDHAIYPDCRLGFLRTFEKAAMLGNDGFGNSELRLSWPFVNLSKADIVAHGARLGVPLESTYSCYEGGLLHCGRCSTDLERREAFELAGVQDTTQYRDGRPWREILHEVEAGSDVHRS